VTYSISVVTVCYNNLHGLRATANSILAQRNQAVQWVVIDGGSKDGTVEFLARGEPACEFVSEPDNGIYDAMLKGLNRAAGDYVVFLNAGDELAASNSLKEARRELDGTDVLFFDTRVWGLHQTYVRTARGLQAATYTVPAIQQSTIYKRKSLLRLRWPTDYAVCGDYYIAAQMLAQSWTWKKVGREFSKFQLGGLSTFSVARLSREAWRVQKEVLRLSLITRIAHFVRRYLTGLTLRTLFLFKNWKAAA
jgi:putative colanic acid biosynthesis glycosyltransferase